MRAKTTFRPAKARVVWCRVPWLATEREDVSDPRGTTANLRALRDEQGIDQTLQNLLRALTLNLELRARYRVFEFEAAQDGHVVTANLFRELREQESQQIAALMSGLKERLGDLDIDSAATAP